MAKREKHVYAGYDELSHVFIREGLNNKLTAGAWGRAGNVFYDEKQIFSYGRHFCIAAFHPKNPKILFVNDNRYSSSTSAHQGALRFAISPEITSVYCPEPDGDVRQNVAAYLGRIATELQAAESVKIRKSTKAWHFLQANSIIGEAETYLKIASPRENIRRRLAKAAKDEPIVLAFLKNGEPLLEASAEIMKDYDAKLKIRRDKLDKKREAEREARRIAYEIAHKKEAARAAKLRKVLPKITPVLTRAAKQIIPHWRETGEWENVISLLTPKEFERVNKLLPKGDRLERTEYISDLGYDTLAERAFCEASPERKFRSYEGSLLRIDGDTVETSSYARVPLREAIIMYKAYIAGKPIHGKEIGGFHILEADTEHIRIGCHNILRAEIDNFGKLIAGL